MRKAKFKNVILNWPFSSDDYASFLRDIWSKIDPIPGFLSKQEAFFLYHTAKNLKGAKRDVDQPMAASVVEIGSYKGKSSVAIGLGLKENPYQKFSLVCVDPFFDTERDKNLKREFLRTIFNAGLHEHIICISDYSENAVRKWNKKEGIAMLWIDGNHEFEFVQDDFLSWGRYLIPGGVVAFHDWYLLGVKETIEKYFFSKNCYVDIAVINYNLIAARKTDRMPSWQERATKKKIYWALKTNSTNPFMALLGMLYDWFNCPFGSLWHFFTERLHMQKEKECENLG